MLRLSPPCVAAAGLVIALLAVSASARVLTLSYQSDTTAIVRDAFDGNVAASTLTSAQGRLLVEAGVLAADPDHDLLYVAANADPAGPAAGTPAALLVNAYGSMPVPLGSVQAPVGRYFAVLAFDAPASRLVGIVADPTNIAVAQVFTVVTNSGASLGAPSYTDTLTGCCRFNSGVAAWRAPTQDLLVIGRRSGDSEDQLLRFDFGVGTALPDAYPITGGDQVVALAVDPQDASVYALARSVLGFTFLAKVTWSTPGTAASLSPIGSAPATCCYAAAGPAAIDGSGAARALFALTRDATTPGPMQLSRFDFVSGNPVVVNATMQGYGLWSDPSAMLDRIFADGFD